MVIRVVSHRSPSPSTIDRRVSDGAGRRARRRAPCGPSNTVAGPVAPAAASRAARIPDCDASPGCSCLVDAPVARNSSSPPAWLPAMPSAFDGRGAVETHAAARRPAPTRTPRTTMRGVQAAGVERVRRRARRSGRPSRSRRPRPSAPRDRSRRPARRPRSAAGSTTAVACTSPPAWVSSKSRACTSVPVARAAAGAPTRSPRPSSVASGGPPSPGATVDGGVGGARAAAARDRRAERRRADAARRPRGPRPAGSVARRPGRQRPAITGGGHRDAASAGGGPEGARDSPKASRDASPAS